MTTLTLDPPAALDTHEAQPVPLSREPSDSAAPRSVLVIDDDELYRDLTRLMLEQLGCTVETAWNGQVGWQMAQLHDYDLVLCDIIMPYMDGFQTIPLIRRQHPGTPIIAMSGGGLLHSEVYGKMALGLGADAILGKPFGLDDLRQKIEQLTRPAAPAPAL